MYFVYSKNYQRGSLPRLWMAAIVIAPTHALWLFVLLQGTQLGYW